MRRLVVTGKDTPENLKLLFGPKWLRGVSSTHAQCRLELLCQPPPGSPCYLRNVLLDSGSPGQSPRTASEAEQRRVDEIRWMQRSMRETMPPGEPITVGEMADLASQVGRADDLPFFKIALDTMEQDV